MRKKVIIVFFVAVAAYFLHEVFLRLEETEVIRTESGDLKGFKSKSRDGREYFQFLGIPYARPPVGELRFEPPQKAKKWEGILDATKYGYKCPQLNPLFNIPEGDEDCLTLNLHTPRLPTPGQRALPVMVYFHGGLYTYGSGYFCRADYFMDEDVILVVVHYRLTSFGKRILEGFLNTGDGVVAGNMGLKDQNMALRWVQENIEHFGGDPNEVTIFGQSAGAAAVHLHVLSPMSKGLFKRAISQSGAALNPWTIWSDPAGQAKRFAHKFNCSTENTKEMVACMKKLTMQEIVRAHGEIYVDYRDIITIFVPTVESGKATSETFLPAHPRELLRAKNFNKVPWLVGTNGQDGLMLSAAIVRTDAIRDTFYHEYESVLDKVLYMKSNANASKIKDFYMPSPPTLEDVQSMTKLTDMLTDRFFSNGVREAALLQSAEAPVYLYNYNYKGAFRLGNFLAAVKGKYPVILELIAHVIGKLVYEYILGNDDAFYGVGHCDELALLFDTPWVTNIKKNHKDYKMSKAMVKLWTSFAQDRKPLEFLGVKFNPLNPKEASIKYLNINSTPSILDDPFVERYKLWESINASPNL